MVNNSITILANRASQQSNQKVQPADLKSVDLDQKLSAGQIVQKRIAKVCNEFNG